MKRTFVGLSAIFLMMVGMVGSASATLWDSTTDLNQWLWGSNKTFTWEMAMPDEFVMPPATVTSASLTVYANYVTGNNDIVSIVNKLDGTWSAPLLADTTGVGFFEFSWLQCGNNVNPFNPIEANIFDVKGSITEPWGPNEDMLVALVYNEKIYLGPIFLDYAVLKLDWESNVDQNNGAPVPEPGTMALLGFGVLGLVVYGKRRMNRDA